MAAWSVLSAPGNLPGGERVDLRPDLQSVPAFGRKHLWPQRARRPGHGLRLGLSQSAGRGDAGRGAARGGGTTLNGRIHARSRTAAVSAGPAAAAPVAAARQSVHASYAWHRLRPIVRRGCHCSSTLKIQLNDHGSAGLHATFTSHAAVAKVTLRLVLRTQPRSVHAHSIHVAETRWASVK